MIIVWDVVVKVWLLTRCILNNLIPHMDSVYIYIARQIILLNLWRISCMISDVVFQSTALITDLYMDRATFKGQHVKSKVPKLLELLDNGDLESLLAFFDD